MKINSKAWNPSMHEVMSLARWLDPNGYKDPVTVTDREIILTELTLKNEGCNPDITTTITLPLDEYRLLISDAQKKAKEEGCKGGREEAWDLARRIVTTHGADLYTGTEFDSAFGSHNANTIFGMPADDALALDKKYQEDKKTLRIGDEVEFGVLRGYIIEILLSDEVRVLTKIYGTFTVSCKDCKKTGKHSGEIEKVMASFEEDKE